MKALVGAFNQEKALVGAFSVIVQLHRIIAYCTSGDTRHTRERRGTSAARDQMLALIVLRGCTAAVREEVSVLSQSRCFLARHQLQFS